MSILQLVVTTSFVLSLKSFGVLEVDSLDWARISPYLPYAGAFGLGIFANMKSLASSNVETVIVFRACAPIAVAILDWMFLGREFPSTRGLGALMIVFFGAIAYVQTDSEFHTLGIWAYFWPFVYLLLLCFQMTYGKMLVKGVHLATVSGPVLYTNILSIPVMLIFMGTAHEFEKLPEVLGNIQAYPFGAFAAIGFSCVVGTGISYAGWYCRSVVSATSYTVVGVMNKFFTILLNVMFWDKHASAFGILALSVCLLGGAVYEQAPLKSESQTHHHREEVGIPKRLPK